MMHMKNKGRVLRLSLLLSLLVGGGLAIEGRAPSRAYAASPAPPVYTSIIPTGYDSPQFGSKQYAYATWYSSIISGLHLEELYKEPDGWHYADLTAFTGAPPLSEYTRIVGYDSPQFSSKQYAYVDPSDHVQELYYARANGYWRADDLTDLTGAPLVMQYQEGSLIGFDAPEFGSKYYTYIAQNGHIVELSYWGNSWHVLDLTAITGAPSAVGATLVGFDSPQYGSRQYAYLDSNHDLEEIFCRTIDECGVADLTAFTGAPPAYPYTQQDVSGFDSPSFQSKQYAYVDIYGHLQELYYARVNGFWRANDLTTLYQAPMPNLNWFNARFNLAGFASPQFGSKQYAYIDGQYHLDEVSYWSGTWHTTYLTPVAATYWQAPYVVGFDSPQFGSRQYGYTDPSTKDFEETYYVSGIWYTVDLTQIARP